MEKSDKICLKCGKKELQSDFYFASPYGLCNSCHSLFLPYITKALKKFLKTRKGSGKKSWITRRKHFK
jgi:hypothetical protein